MLFIITTVVSIAIGVVSLVALTDYPRAGVLVAIAAPVQDIDIGSFDRLLDLYVRDGLVYYAALRSDRAGLDRFVRSLRTEPVEFDTQPINVRKAQAANGVSESRRSDRVGAGRKRNRLWAGEYRDRHRRDAHTG